MLESQIIQEEEEEEEEEETILKRLLGDSPGNTVLDFIV